MRPCHLYVLGAEPGPWKVGNSFNPNARAKDILRWHPGRTVSSAKAGIVLSVELPSKEDALDAERRVQDALSEHQRQKTWQRSGSIRRNLLEWFDCSLSTIRTAVESELARRESGGRGEGE